jgi:molybdopterin-guanine dinucleotide biosynthesis protein A
MGGADKGWIEYRGTPLIQLALQRLQPQVDETLISANRNLARYRSLGVLALPDDPSNGEFAGPLAGILVGLRAAHSPWLAVIPCDAPNAPEDLVRRLQRGVAGGVAAVAHADGRMQPLFCLLHRDLVPSLAAFVAQGERKVALWLDQVRATHVPFDDTRAFINVNALSEVPDVP